MIVVFIICFLASSATFLREKISLNVFQLPIINLCQKYKLLLDTGSKDTWIADLSCLGCPEKVRACPKSQLITHQIKYFKGNVKGDVSFVKTCLGTHRVICATQAQGMESIGAMGILGLRGNSTGKDIIKSYLQNHHIQQQSLSFYKGFKENLLFFGEIPNKFIAKEVTVIDSEQEWHIKLFDIAIDKLSINNSNNQLFIDTGSNMLVLPPQIYIQMKETINNKMEQSGCQKSQYQNFSYYCFKPMKIQQKIILKLSDDQSFVQLLLSQLLVIDKVFYKLLIESGTSSIIVVGGSLMKKYILSFHLNGTLKIYNANSAQLMNSQIDNFNLLVFQYMLIVVISSLLWRKIYHIAEVAINRKIVI